MYFISIDPLAELFVASLWLPLSDCRFSAAFPYGSTGAQQARERHPFTA